MRARVNKRGGGGGGGEREGERGEGRGGGEYTYPPRDTPIPIMAALGYSI